MSKQQSSQPGWSGYLRPMMRQSRFKLASTLSTVKEWAGSNTSISSISGSMQNILDPTKMMSMQEDARSHKISSEVMKANLYKSVTRPRSRCYRMPNSRTWSNDDEDSNAQSSWYPKYYQSLPPTPLVSGRTTPNTSPTRSHSFRFFSRGTTPRCTSPNRILEEEEEGEGLAGVLKPRPRFIKANQQVFPELNQPTQGLTL